jgi:hypothetical protein
MKKIKGPLLIVSFLFVATGCSIQKKMVQTELYFGLSKNNGSIITDSAWNIFVQQDVSKVFSKGFTVVNSEGKWVDQLYKKMHSEPSRIITSVCTMTGSLSAQIDSLRERYKILFEQEAVLRIDKKASINF